jgi:hypothetical protein
MLSTITDPNSLMVLSNISTTLVNLLQEPSLRGFGISYQPSQSEERRVKLRSLLVEYAKKMKMNPLIAESWYSVNSSQVDPSVCIVLEYEYLM